MVDLNRPRDLPRRSEREASRLAVDPHSGVGLRVRAALPVASVDGEGSRKGPAMAHSPPRGGPVRPRPTGRARENAAWLSAERPEGEGRAIRIVRMYGLTAKRKSLGGRALFGRKLP